MGRERWFSNMRLPAAALVVVFAGRYLYEIRTEPEEQHFAVLAACGCIGLGLLCALLEGDFLSDATTSIERFIGTTVVFAAIAFLYSSICAIAVLLLGYTFSVFLGLGWISRQNPWLFIALAGSGSFLLPALIALRRARSRRTVVRADGAEE